MKKKQKTKETEPQDRDRELMLDLKTWIEDKDFEPPFPYNVLWNNEEPKHKRLQILAEAISLVYKNELENNR